MINYLAEWAEKNKVHFKQLGITTDKIFVSQNEEYAGGYVDHSTDKYVGRISLSGENFIDIEIIDIESEVKIMVAHYNNPDNLEVIAQPYIHILADKKLINCDLIFK